MSEPWPTMEEDFFHTMWNIASLGARVEKATARIEKASQGMVEIIAERDRYKAALEQIASPLSDATSPGFEERIEIARRALEAK